jgi:GNAT superfamily N-acetyltransferase
MNECIEICRATAAQAAAWVEDLADVLIDCVQGGASVGFMLPMDRAKALRLWQTVAEAVAHHERALFVACDLQGRPVGTVQMIMSLPENQPHRADVAKMLVHRKARRRGIARALLSVLDDEARKEGKTVLVLDTVTGGDAQRLYEAAGWRSVGEVPNYALMPNGDFCGTTFYYKRL